MGTRRRGITVGAALTTGLLAWACGGEGAGGGRFADRFDTLPGGAVRVSNPATGVWGEGERWRLEEDLRIGSLDSEGPELFGQIADVTVADDGSIYVLESQAGELRVFGPDGSWIRTVGRPGEGPGELNVSFGGEVLEAPDGRVWINNMLNRRWDAFDPGGEYLGSTPMSGGFFGGGTVGGTDGSFYQRSQVRVEGAEPRPVVLRLRPGGDSLVVSDTIPVPPLPEGETATVELSSGGNRLVMNLPVPFVHQPSWTFAPRGHFWVDPGEGYRLLAVAPGGDTVRIVEREYEPVPVTRAEIDEAMERFTSGPLANADVPVERSQIPSHHPPIGQFRGTDDGYLWVRRPLGEDRRAWDVFDPEGIYLGQVESEVDLGRLTIHAITPDAVYGVLTDEVDVPYVVRLRIGRGPGT